MQEADVRTHTFTWHRPPDGAAAAPRGRAYLEALRDGSIPPPPMVALLGFRLVEVGDGRVVFTAEPQEYLYNGIGLVHGGFAAALFDTAVGCAAGTCVGAEPGGGHDGICTCVSSSR
ncbi:MAG: PaaI family thioesterase [Candidatus Velthaea sp.]